MMNAVLQQPVIRLYQKATGRRILECLDELNRTQWLTRDKLLELQRSKLHRLLEYAYEYVPYYHRLFDNSGFRPAEVVSDLGAMRKIPVLTKAQVYEDPDSLVTTDPQLRKEMTAESTSGSTGRPLAVMLDNNGRDRSTAGLFRYFGWTGWRLGECWASIRGPFFDQRASQTVRSRIRDWVLNHLPTNAYALTGERMCAFANEVRRRRPRILHAYPSSTCWFAEFVEKHDMDEIKFDAVSTFAEPVHLSQRELIAKVFDAEVFNYYATAEQGGLASECEAHTGLHVIMENVYLDILHDGRSAKAGELGEVNVTNLNNYAMPLIRYNLEDVGAWSVKDDCPCGREMPIMDLKLARSIDTFKMSDGRVVFGDIGWPDYRSGIKRYQLVQKSLDHFIARIVKDEHFDEAELPNMERYLKLALGEHVTVAFEFPEDIPVHNSGKFRFVISEVGQASPPGTSQ
jgi:phenylacetate-CoA ligase